MKRLQAQDGTSTMWTASQTPDVPSPRKMYIYICFCKHLAYDPCFECISQDCAEDLWKLLANQESSRIALRLPWCRVATWHHHSLLSYISVPLQGPKGTRRKHCPRSAKRKKYGQLQRRAESRGQDTSIALHCMHAWYIHVNMSIYTYTHIIHILYIRMRIYIYIYMYIYIIWLGYGYDMIWYDMERHDIALHGMAWYHLIRSCQIISYHESTYCMCLVGYRPISVYKHPMMFRIMQMESEI